MRLIIFFTACFFSCVSHGQKQNFEQYSSVFETIFNFDIFDRLYSYQKIGEENSIVVFKDDKIISFYYTDSENDNIYYFGESGIYRNNVEYFIVVDSIGLSNEYLTFLFHTSSRMRSHEDKEYIRVKTVFRKRENQWECYHFEVFEESCCKW